MCVDRYGISAIAWLGASGRPGYVKFLGRNRNFFLEVAKKEPADSQVAGQRLTDLQKAAIVLIALGPSQSAAILKHMAENDADRAAHAIATCDTATPDQIQAALEEFDQYATSHRLMMRGGMEYAQKVLVEAYGSEAANRLLERLLKAGRSESATFDNFRKVDPQQLAKFIQDEHPQTIALILSNLDADQAATLLSSLPIETRTDVAVRMADLDQISPEVVRNIATVIDQKLRHLGELSREAVGGVTAVANMFNRLDPSTCSELMDAVEVQNPVLFENIRRFMFVFRDLEELDQNSLRALMSNVDRNTLLLALKGANESLKQKFFQTQSQRAAEMLADDLGSLGPVKLKDVEAAQQKVITVAREMEKAGTINLKNSPNDQYIE
jgi:flagellar motor switch protein FliG